MFSPPVEGSTATTSSGVRTCFGVAFGLLLSILTVHQVSALPEDKEQPIHISADQALRNEKEGYTIYSGNVEMNQGSMHITADKITIFRLVEEADKIVAKGDPAVLQQQPEADKGLVTASAGVIEYYKNEARVHLKNKAIIEQNGSKVTGETIDYYINEQLVKAGSDRNREDSKVQVVIESAALQKGEKDSGAANSK